MDRPDGPAPTMITVVSNDGLESKYTKRKKKKTQNTRVCSKAQIYVTNLGFQIIQGQIEVDGPFSRVLRTR